jgi:acylphosphatase
MVRYRVLITGQVQGVNFRAACRRMALQHGVRGWVRPTETLASFRSSARVPVPA